MGPRCQALGVPHPATNRSFSFRVVIQATVSERETDLKDTHPFSTTLSTET